MQRQRRRDTAPELAIRRILHAQGVRFFVDRKVLPELMARVDIVFPRKHVAVFVDGCFWHRCPQHGTLPRTNTEWWAQKLARNVDRDTRTNHVLQDAGWTVIRAWEHEAPETVARRVRDVVVGEDLARSDSLRGSV